MSETLPEADTDPTFGHWLAGFVAGEGCFMINPCQGRPYCSFVITLRDDDREILEEIRHRLGIGSVSAIPERGKSKAQAVFRITQKLECLTLVTYLDKYSLRAKKARDYSVWRRAVLAHNSGKPFVHFAEDLREARAYRPGDLL